MAKVEMSERKSVILNQSSDRGEVSKIRENEKKLLSIQETFLFTLTKNRDISFSFSFFLQVPFLQICIFNFYASLFFLYVEKYRTVLESIFLSVLRCLVNFSHLFNF